MKKVIKKIFMLILSLLGSACIIIFSTKMGWFSTPLILEFWEIISQNPWEVLRTLGIFIVALVPYDLLLKKEKD